MWLILVQNILMASLSPLWVKITDFGISKRWSGTALRSQCGTPNYQAPELSGLLPTQMTANARSYSWSVDIWSLGAVVYQVLTAEIPFLTIDEGSADSAYYSMEPSTNNDLLKAYCADLEPFPTLSLTSNGASVIAIDFIKSLMVPDPKLRPSAADALKSDWIVEMPTSNSGPPDTICSMAAESAIDGEQLHDSSQRIMPVPTETLTTPKGSTFQPPIIQSAPPPSMAEELSRQFRETALIEPPAIATHRASDGAGGDCDPFEDRARTVVPSQPLRAEGGSSRYDRNSIPDPLEELSETDDAHRAQIATRRYNTSRRLQEHPRLGRSGQSPHREVDVTMQQLSTPTVQTPGPILIL